MERNGNVIRWDQSTRIELTSLPVLHTLSLYTPHPVRSFAFDKHRMNIKGSRIYFPYMGNWFASRLLSSFIPTRRKRITSVGKTRLRCIYTPSHPATTTTTTTRLLDKKSIVWDRNFIKPYLDSVVRPDQFFSNRIQGQVKNDHYLICFLKLSWYANNSQKISASAWDIHRVFLSLSKSDHD